MLRSALQGTKEEMIQIRLATLPLSTNAMYRTFRGRILLSKAGRENKEAMAWEARAQYRLKPQNGAVRADVYLHWPDRRKHDLDNIKSLLDAMNGILWEDDSMLVELRLRKDYDRNNPGVDIVIY